MRLDDPGPFVAAIETHANITNIRHIFFGHVLSNRFAGAQDPRAAGLWGDPARARADPGPRQRLPGRVADRGRPIARAASERL
jgi:hypothetical protein